MTVIRRLVFLQGDTLFIAKTGFGKSLILQAFTILTGLLTIQIVPLDKLGDQQLLDLKRLKGTRPCLLNSTTKKADRNLLRKVKQGAFSHVLVGPE